jgi:hypothetical protein
VRLHGALLPRARRSMLKRRSGFGPSRPSSLCVSLRTRRHTGNGTKQTVEAEVQKAVDAVLQSAQLPASLLVARLCVPAFCVSRHRLRVLTCARCRFCTYRRWQSQKYIRSGGYGGYTMSACSRNVYRRALRAC